jgi:hypothetical protein
MDQFSTHSIIRSFAYTETSRCVLNRCIFDNLALERDLYNRVVNTIYTRIKDTNGDRLIPEETKRSLPVKTDTLPDTEIVAPTSQRSHNTSHKLEPKPKKKVIDRCPIERGDRTIKTGSRDHYVLRHCIDMLLCQESDPIFQPWGWCYLGKKWTSNRWH